MKWNKTNYGNGVWQRYRQNNYALKPSDEPQQFGQTLLWNCSCHVVGHFDNLRSCHFSPKITDAVN